MKKIYALILCLITVLNSYADDFYRVNKDKLIVKDKPGQWTRTLGYIPNGSNVKVLDSSNTRWYKVKVVNGTGFVESKYLNKIVANNLEDTSSYNKRIVLVFIIVLGTVIILYYIFKPKKNEQMIVNNVVDIQKFNQQLLVKRKSVGLAIVLALIFGPFGMFYATVRGAFAMLLLPILGVGLFIYAGQQNLNALMVTMFIWLLFFASFYWIICVVWAGVAAAGKNKIIYR